MALTELRLLNNINEPGLATLDGYERFGGYKALRKALEMDARRRSSHELEESGLRGRGGAGFSMGKKASFIPKGDDAQVPRAATRTSPSRAPSRTAC